MEKVSKPKYDMCLGMKYFHKIYSLVRVQLTYNLVT